MRAISYKQVENKVVALYLASQGTAGVITTGLVQVHLNTWAAQYWEKFFWPEWILTEERQFRPSWAIGTTYAAAEELYHVRSGKYFQSLRAANLAQEPYDTASQVENSAWWAACQASYSGDDYATGTAATVGLILRNPVDNRYYQCHTAHTTGATLDATKFGILTPFHRSIDYQQAWQSNDIGLVKACWTSDPRNQFSSSEGIDFVLADKIYVAGCQNVVWLEFQARPPEWTGALYDATTVYAADGQAYDATTGDFYRSLSAGNTGNPLTDTTLWERIQFPWVLRDCASQAAVACLLAGEGQQDKRIVDLSLADGFADLEMKKILRQQGQSRRLPVRLSNAC